MGLEDKAEKIVNGIATRLDARVRRSVGVELEGIVLTGSMAAYMKDRDSLHHPSWTSIPDINLYAYVDGEPFIQAATNYMLSEAIIETQSEFPDVNMILDLHPSSLFVDYPDPSKQNIQLTTRAISTKDTRLMADYCWQAWKSGYLTLVPEGGDFFEGRVLDESMRDATWIRNMYLGLVSYGNQLLLCPLSDPFNRDERVFDEGYRYMKEIAKDGVQMGFPADEAHLALDIIKEWKTSAQDFYTQVYGKLAGQIIGFLNQMDQDYWKSREKPGSGMLLVEKALQLRDIVFEKGFKNRALEICGKVEPYERMVQWY